MAINPVNALTLPAGLYRRFQAAMRPLGRLPAHDHTPLITCLSGGADSTALALLAEIYARQTRRQHTAIIIDHGIRPAAAQEAARTMRRMRDCGIGSIIRRVTAKTPSSSIQAWARAQGG